MDDQDPEEVAYQEGVRAERERIVKLLRERAERAGGGKEVFVEPFLENLADELEGQE